MNKSRNTKNSLKFTMFIFVFLMTLNITTRIAESLSDFPTNPQEIMFTKKKLISDSPVAEFSKAVDKNSMETVLEINHIDETRLRKGLIYISPTNDLTKTSFAIFPKKILSLENTPKIIIINQKIQWFGAYENGLLLKSGPISSGKNSTPTPNGLFYVNWKGKRIISTKNNEWLLKWNMNIDNKRGISIHQYTLPGYPASHSCIRLSTENARWLYSWVNTWKLNKSGTTKLKNGTPVIIYGTYDFKKASPWSLLVTNPSLLTLNTSELENIIFLSIK